MTVRFRKLSTESILPVRKSEGAAGFDLYYLGPEYNLRPGDRHVFDTMAGVIDSDYRGELKVILINHGFNPVTFKPKDRIAQLVVTSYERRSSAVGTLSDTCRGEGGFGSTGK